MTKNQQIKKGRLAFIYFGVILIFLIIISRLIYLGIYGDKVKISNIYENNKIIKRGNIIDRNGSIVATDLATKSLYISTILLKNEKSIAKGLAKIFSDLSYDEIYKKIKNGKKRHNWILIRRNITPLEERKVKNLKKAGLIFEDDRARIYPQKSILSHLVGYVDLDRKGLSGIERQYNKELSQGKNIQIAADIRIQDILNNELQKGIEEFKAKAASGIIMNVNNGEILALSSLPSFDPNLQSKATSNQRFNRITNGVYELGSIFKIFTNAIAFDNDLIKMDEKFDVTKPIKYGRFTINDDHPEEGEIDVATIFAKSSNIGTVKIAQKIGIDLQKKYLKKLGLLNQVNADFPGLGRVIYPRKWREINLYTISYGHGIAVTPLHIASAVSATINGGKLYQPSFLKRKENPKGKKVFQDSTSKIMRQMLRQVATKGTGRNANAEGYLVGGKTGTAEKAQGGSYNKKQTISSFVAVFPMNKPQYLVYVIFDNTDYKFNTGGMVAAPVAGRIIKNIAPIIGLMPQIDNKENN